MKSGFFGKIYKRFRKDLEVPEGENGPQVKKREGSGNKARTFAPTLHIVLT